MYRILISFSVAGRWLVAQAIPIVDIPFGVTYHGITEPSGLESFRNILFGQSTAGEGRFAPPRPILNFRHAIINATEPGPVCPQQMVPVALLPIFSNVTNISEDCLNLRITRPANTMSSSNLPVMVYIYGGGESIGQIYDQLYTPDGLVLNAAGYKTPVIYVAMNYRVNIFGFASSPTLRKDRSLNVGLLDQRLALEWIQGHIRYFGGDENQVTIFGESDGATNVGLQLTSYGGEGKAPFNRAIMQSGSPIGIVSMTTNKSSVAFEAVASATNCSNANGRTELQCLRALPLEVLVDAAVAHEMEVSAGFGFDVFTPIVDGDFIPDSPSKLVNSGRFYKNIPIIAGWNSDDGSLFVPQNLTTDASLEAFLQTKWTYLNDSTVAQILAQYPLSSFAPSGPFPAQFSRASRIYRDFRFTCGQFDFSYHVTAAGSTSHLYQLNQTILSIPSFFGVTHISDVPYVFDEVSFVVKNVSASDTALASTMSSLWAAFASDANLVSTDFGADSNIWPAAYSSSATPWPTSASVKILGGPDEGIASFEAMSALNAPGEEDTLSRCQFVASIFDQLGT